METAIRPKERSTTQQRGPNEAFFASGSLKTCRSIPTTATRLGAAPLLPSSTNKTCTVASDFLYLACHFGHRATVLFIGWRHMNSQQMAKCIHRHVYHAAFTSLVAVISRSLAAFRRGLEGTTIHFHRRRLLIANTIEVHTTSRFAVSASMQAGCAKFICLHYQFARLPCAISCSDYPPGL